MARSSVPPDPGLDPDLDAACAPSVDSDVEAFASQSSSTTLPAEADSARTIAHGVGAWLWRTRDDDAWARSRWSRGERASSGYGAPRISPSVSGGMGMGMGGGGWLSGEDSVAQVVLGLILLTVLLVAWPALLGGAGLRWTLRRVGGDRALLWAIAVLGAVLGVFLLLHPARGSGQGPTLLLQFSQVRAALVNLLRVGLHTHQWTAAPAWRGLWAALEPLWRASLALAPAVAVVTWARQGLRGRGPAGEVEARLLAREQADLEIEHRASHRAARRARALSQVTLMTRVKHATTSPQQQQIHSQWQLDGPGAASTPRGTSGTSGSAVGAASRHAPERTCRETERSVHNVEPAGSAASASPRPGGRQRSLHQRRAEAAGRPTQQQQQSQQRQEKRESRRNSGGITARLLAGFSAAGTGVRHWRARRRHAHPPAQRVVLGVPVRGDLTAWVSRGLFTVPRAELQLPGVVIGASGSGKTETVLRLAAEAVRAHHWQVLWLDGKGDEGTAARFLATMRELGVGRVRLFPAEPYDGWRGDGRALLNRLLALETFTEPYYAAIAKQMLDLAVRLPGGLPADADELLRRLDPEVLVTAYAGRRDARFLLSPAAGREAGGVTARYSAFFRAVQGQLDGDWAFEDVDAAYLLLRGLALKDEAASLGRFLLEDFAHYAAMRKHPGRHTLLIIDEYSALSLQVDATNLFERLRTYGASVLVTSQSYAGLGEHADRLLDTANMLLLHRCSDPTLIIGRAGTQRRIELAVQTVDYAPAGGGFGGAGTRAGAPAGRAGLASTVRTRERAKIDPNAVRQLEAGEVFAIVHGRQHRVRIIPQTVVPTTLAEISHWIRSAFAVASTTRTASTGAANRPLQATAPATVKAAASARGTGTARGTTTSRSTDSGAHRSARQSSPLVGSHRNDSSAASQEHSPSAPASSRSTSRQRQPQPPPETEEAARF